MKARKWLSTGDLVSLVADYCPVSAHQIRSWCEEGRIAPEFVKRIPSPHNRGAWRISIKGLESILDGLLGLSSQEKAEVYALLNEKHGA